MYRVVVADDDSKTCKKAVEFLQNNGYQVVGEASDGLEDRKYIEKAKGLLMEYRKLSENEAYSYIRRQAMDKEQTMAEIARILLMAYNVQ